VDTTIRNLDEDAYRELKARAALEGKTIGEVVSAAIRAYTSRPLPRNRKRSLADLEPEDYGAGSETSSERVDDVVYGG
jgi:plasmid stability protein